MRSFQILLNNLLGLYIIFFCDHNGYCLITVWQPPSPNISLPTADSGKQSLVVSWLVNHSDLVADISEIQISRTENYIIIFSENVSASSSESDQYSWSWTSDVPLECVDHSVRIRHFYNLSAVSHWSSWKTYPGVQTMDELKIFPFQSMLREGTRAIFCCIPPPGVNITSMAVAFQDRPLISLGSRVKAIAEDKLTIKQHSSLFYESFYPITISCRDSAGHVSDIWNYITLPPDKPRNISCVTSNTVTVSCTWNSEGKEQHSDLNSQTQTLHIENSDQAPIPCQHSSCSFVAIPHLKEYKIRVVVKNKVGEEAESYSFNISDRVFPVVLGEMVSAGVTDATVTWILQGNLTQLDVLCQVNTVPHGTTELSCTSTNGRCKAQLEHLIPNTRYSTRVRCSVGGKFWGMWTQPFSFTTCPLVSVNLWRRIQQQSIPDSRQVTLLWALDIPGSASKVAIHSYIFQWSKGSQNGTETKASGQNQIEVSIGPEQYDFSVQAVITGGLSIPAYITVPKKDGEERPPVQKQLSGSTVGGFNLSWSDQVSATCGYTVEWCIQGIVFPCTLQWMKISERDNTLLLPAGNFKAGCRYTFNIYGCEENGYRLLEIQTGYIQELKSVPSPSLVEPIERTSSAVSLEWHYDEADPAHPAFITGYLVVVQDTLPRQAENVFNVSVADPRSKSVTIEGLQENHEYTFSVSALTKNGPGQLVSVTIRTRTNYSAHLAKMLTPIVLLLGCIVLLWPKRKMLKNGLKEIFTYPAGMNIKTSELNAFLNNASEAVLSNKLEECISCDIEILNTSPPPKEKTSLKDCETVNKLPFSPFQSFTSPLSLFSVSIQADYCPQSPTLLLDTAGGQQTTYIENKSYFHSMVKDLFKPRQGTMNEMKPSFEAEAVQESCSVIYGYVSKDNF